MQKLNFCKDCFANFPILQDINKMIISHITTKYSDTFFLLMIRYSTYAVMRDVRYEQEFEAYFLAHAVR